jgi:hypothetical protein
MSDVETIRRSAEGNLAAICDVVNAWAREENFCENCDYLGFMKIRDHIHDLWGHVNERWFKKIEEADGRYLRLIEERDNQIREITKSIRSRCWKLEDLLKEASTLLVAVAPDHCDVQPFRDRIEEVLK